MESRENPSHHLTQRIQLSIISHIKWLEKCIINQNKLIHAQSTQNHYALTDINVWNNVGMFD